MQINFTQPICLPSISQSLKAAKGEYTGTHPIHTRPIHLSSDQPDLVTATFRLQFEDQFEETLYFLF